MRSQMVTSSMPPALFYTGLSQPAMEAKQEGIVHLLVYVLVWFLVMRVVRLAIVFTLRSVLLAIKEHRSDAVTYMHKNIISHPHLTAGRLLYFTEGNKEDRRR